MNREVSAYLDCVRLLCALLVLFAHVELNWVPGVWHFFVPLGNEALAVLFALSGFVIAYASAARESSLRSYLIHRAARLYSLLIPCVIVTYMLDMTGKHFMTGYYLTQSFPPLGSDFQQVLLGLLSLTFLGELWGGDLYPGSMAPYWTLPYEVVYYLVFGAAWYLRGRWRFVMLVVVTLIAGPPVMIFFPLWLLGAAAYWLAGRWRLGRVAGRAIFFGGLGALLAVEAVSAHARFRFGYGDQEAPDLWPFYLAGLFFAVITLGFRFAEITISRYTGWARWAAGASATLYLLHFAAGRFVNGLIPFHWLRIERWPLIVTPILLLSLLVAHFSERRKEDWRYWIEAGLTAVQVRLARRRSTS